MASTIGKGHRYIQHAPNSSQWFGMPSLTPPLLTTGGAASSECECVCIHGNVLFRVVRTLYLAIRGHGSLMLKKVIVWSHSSESLQEFDLAFDECNYCCGCVRNCLSV